MTNTTTKDREVEWTAHYGNGWTVIRCGDRMTISRIAIIHEQMETQTLTVNVRDGKVIAWTK